MRYRAVVRVLAGMEGDRRRSCPSRERVRRITRSRLAAVGGRGDLRLVEADGELASRVGVAFGVTHGTQRRCDIHRRIGAVAVEVRPEPATASSARRKSWGSTLPRLAARRRIPAQAFALK